MWPGIKMFGYDYWELAVLSGWFVAAALWRIGTRRENQDVVNIGTGASVPLLSDEIL